MKHASGAVPIERNISNGLVGFTQAMIMHYTPWPLHLSRMLPYQERLAICDTP